MKLPLVSEEKVARILANPDNARKAMDCDGLRASIQRDGILQALGAVEDGEFLRLVWGHRRLECARSLGMDTAPCRVFRGIAYADVRRLALVENVQRLDLDPSAEAAAYKAYLDAEKATAKELAHLLGVSDGKISKKLAILTLVPELVRLIDSGLVPETSAADLGKLSETEQRERAELVTAPISRAELARAIGKKTGRKPERAYRLTKGGVSLVSGSDDLDSLLAELEDLKKAIRKAVDEGWDFATLARVLRLRKPA